MPLTIPDQTIALQAKAPDSMSSLASMLNIAGGAQALKKAQATYDSDVAQRASDASTADSNAQVAKANIQPLIDQQAAHTDQQQTAAKSARFKLTGDIQGKVNEITSGMIADPTIQSGDMDKMMPTFMRAKQRMIDSGVPENVAEIGMAHLITAAHNNPAGVPDILRTSMLQGQTQPEQGTATQPRLMATNDGSRTNFTETNQFASGGIGSHPIAPIDNNLPLGERQKIVTDQFGNSKVANLDPKTGQITSTAPVPSNGPGGFQSLPAGETPDTLKQVQTIRSNANAAALTAPDQHFNTNQIIKYADESNTGTGAKWLANMRGGFAAVPWTADTTTNLQLLGHAMAQQQGTLAQSAGLNGSNAARDLAKEQTSDGEWTRDAIKSSARTSRALATGSQIYSAGMESNISNGGPFAAREFQNQWAQAANVDSLRLYDAVKNKASDPEGVKQTVEALGGMKSARYQFALKKIDQMQLLLKGAH